MSGSIQPAFMGIRPDQPPGLLGSGLLDGAYTPNPNFTASLASPQMVANPRPGYGNWTTAQPPHPAAAGAAQPTGGLGFTDADVQNALGMLYSQLGVSPEQARAYGSQAGLLGNAAQGPTGQQPSPGAQTLANAYQGFQQFQDVDRQLKAFQAANNGGRSTSTGSEEGGGGW